MSTMPSSRASPMSEIPSESNMGTLSLRDKALIKRNINRHHNSNFRAGYVPVHEQYLHKTGLRGRKTYAFWTLILLLFFLAIGNLFLTFTILGVLRLGQGMESLEFVPSDMLMKFYGETDLDRVYKKDGKLEGFAGSPVEITGDNGSVFLNLFDGKNPSLTLDLNHTNLTNVDGFDIKDPKTGEVIFSTSFPNFGLPRGVNTLDIKLATTHRIASPVNSSLTIRSATYTRLTGNEGTHLDGREIVWSADQDIFLKSINGSIRLSGHDGVSIDVRTIPLAGGIHGQSPRTGQYKICVCMPEGKLFRIAIPADNAERLSRIGCHSVDLVADTSPCM